jgi:radical SAM superfamily enzyme YgiQ (UPF0313 family)
MQARGERPVHEVVLTADRTLMSSYNSSQFIGFAACFPSVIPKWLYTMLFCPQQPRNGGRASVAPAGLRKVEAALLRDGFSRDQVITCHPDDLSTVVMEETRIVGVSTSDPMGLGPASSTFSSLLGRESFTSFYFRNLLNHPAVRGASTTLVVGGPGTWQLRRKDVRENLGIDCIVEGEGEQVVPRVFREILEGEEVPEVVSGGPVPTDEIPVASGPTVNGTVEISRGCGRGCEFCNPNMRLVRHLPLESILAEVRMNLANSPKVTLHAEDVLRYKAKSMVPDRAEVMRLFGEVSRLTDSFGVSHIALSSALAEPRLIEDISSLFASLGNGRTLYAQTGIETGSSRLVSAHMKGKAKPFAPEKWSEVVRDSMTLLQDNSWTVCATLVMGMPGETGSDVLDTLDLVRDLRGFKCLIVPLFFVPLGEMDGGEFFGPHAMTPEHWMLLAECIDHDFEWGPVLMRELFETNRLSGAKSRLMKLAAWYMQHKLGPSMELMREGRSPLDEWSGDGDGIEEGIA